MIRKLFYLFCLSCIFSGCENKLDVSKLELGETIDIINKYPYFTKKTKIKDDVLKGESIIRYVSNPEENRLTNYRGIPGIDDTNIFGTTLYAYQNKLIGYNIVVDKDNFIHFIDKIRKEHGTPTKIIQDETTIIHLEDTIYANELMKLLPQETFRERHEPPNENVFSIKHPSIIIWEKDDSYKVLNIMVDFGFLCKYTHVDREIITNKDTPEFNYFKTDYLESNK